MIGRKIYLGIVFFVVVAILVSMVRDELYAIKGYLYSGSVFCLASILENLVVRKDETEFVTPLAILSLAHMVGLISCLFFWFLAGGWGPPYPLTFIALTYIASAIVYLFAGKTND